MSDAVIKLENVKKSYGSHEVLKGVNMQVNRGDIYGLIGRNGAGKTTIFKMILGLSEMNAGTVSIMGSTNKQTLLKNRSRVGFLVGTRFYSYLNARRNLEYYATVKGIADREQKKEIDRVLEIVGLQGVKKPVKSYSLGMQQRLGIANAILGNPELLILDEPTNGLDPQGIADVRHPPPTSSRSWSIPPTASVSSMRASSSGRSPSRTCRKTSPPWRSRSTISRRPARCWRPTASRSCARWWRDPRWRISTSA